MMASRSVARRHTGGSGRPVQADSTRLSGRSAELRGPERSPVHHAVVQKLRPKGGKKPSETCAHPTTSSARRWQGPSPRLQSGPRLNVSCLDLARQFAQRADGRGSQEPESRLHLNIESGIPILPLVIH